MVTFLILSFLDILEDLLVASISVPSTRLLLFSVSLHVSEPHNKLLLVNGLPPLCNQINPVHTLQQIFGFSYTLPCNICLRLSSNLSLSLFRNKILYPFPINAT